MSPKKAPAPAPEAPVEQEPAQETPKGHLTRNGNWRSDG